MLVPGAWQDAVARTARQFPWYARLPGANAAAFEGLPLLTADVLEAHYYAAGNPLADSGELQGYSTSGTSTGRRKTIYYSAQDEIDYLRIKLDVFRKLLGEDEGEGGSGSGSGSGSGGRYRTAVSDMGTGHAAATAAEVFRRLGMKVHTLSYREPIDVHVDRLRDLRPEVLYTMPSILERILLTAGDASATFGIARVILVGETASPAWMGRAAERLGLPPEAIADTYGSIEIGTIAYFDPRHGRYLLTEGLHAEGIGAEALGDGYEPLAPEERVLVLTSAVREAFPALRYVTYDVVRDLRTVTVDGVPRQSFQGIVKRIGPDLKHGEKISIYDIEEAVCRHVPDVGMRVYVVGNALRVHLYGVAPDSGLIARVQGELQEAVPAIGTMIRGGMLSGIEVVAEPYDDARSREVVKNKKIFYA